MKAIYTGWQKTYLKNLGLYFLIVSVTVALLCLYKSEDGTGFTLLEAIGLVGIFCIIGLGHLIAKGFADRSKNAS